MRKLQKVLIALFLLTFSVPFTAFAGTWQQEAGGWWYQRDDGSYPKDTWEWIDGNGDGVAESYCFDSNGYLYVSTNTPDGFTVNGDGAWAVDGVVQQSAIGPHMDTNRGQTTDSGARAVSEAEKQYLLDALNKTNSLTSMAAAATMNIKITMDGQTIPLTMNMDMKFKDMHTQNMQYLASLDMSTMGMSTSGSVFYTDGYYYVDLMGQKQKTAMDIDTLMQQIQSSTNMNSAGSLGLYQNLQIIDDGNGNRTYTYTSDATQLTSYINDLYAQMGLSAVSADIKGLNGSIVINSEGYCTTEHMNMNMDLFVEGESAVAAIDMAVNYMHPGQPVDFVLPSTEGYQ